MEESEGHHHDPSGHIGLPAVSIRGGGKSELATSGDVQDVSLAATVKGPPANATAEWSLFGRSERFWLSVFLVFFLLISIIGVRLGFGANDDSRAIIERSVPAILAGRYEPSRSLGNPLYEIIASLLYPLGGLTLLNCYSVVVSLASIAVFISILRAQDSVVLLAVAGFMFNPVFLIQATSPTEWAQASFFFLTAIALAQKWLDSNRMRYLALYAAAIAATILTRPDFVIALLALMISIMWQLKFRRHPLFLLLVSNVAAVFVAGLVILAINGGFSSLPTAEDMAGNAGLLRRSVRAALGIVNIFGPMGCLALALAAVALVANTIRTRGADLALSEKLFVVIWPVFILRFAVQPHKLEYLFPVLIVSLLAMSRIRQPRIALAVLVISLTVNSFLSVSFFERPTGSDKLNFALRLNKGALFQDWADRRAIQNALDPVYLSHLSRIVYADEADAGKRPLLSFGLWQLGLTSSEGDLVISEDQLYKLHNLDTRSSEFPPIHEPGGRVFVCNQAFIPSDIGWRLMQPPLTFAAQDSGEDVFRCRVDYSAP